MLIVKTGTARSAIEDVDGDFEDWFADGLGRPVRVCSVFEGDELPPPGACDGAVITGSAAMVGDQDAWIERTAVWLRAAVDAGVPILGICFGHQLLAHALGGRVGPNPRGREIGTITLTLTETAVSDPLFGGLPTRIDVHATHLESVLELPQGARLLASSGLDPNQAFRLADRPVWGLQFHPELTAAVTRRYIEAKRHDMAAEGLDPDHLLSAVRETRWGPEILARFARQADEKIHRSR